METTRKMLALVQSIMHRFGRSLHPEQKRRLERIEAYLIERYNRVVN